MNSFGKSTQYDFDGFEKNLMEEKTNNLVALEFYRDIVKDFGWDNYYVKKGWGSHPSLVVEGIASSEVEFMFGHDKLRISFNRTTFTVPINDQYNIAVKKILEVFDYVKEDEDLENRPALGK